MIKCNDFYNILHQKEITFFTGVPDSLLKDFCAFIQDNVPKEKNIVAANEGNAIALAAGYNLATGKFGLVYMQNSGEGNAINPLASLTDPEVYSIPVLLLIGWRGQPGEHDEPQHVKQGKITLPLLEVLGIPYRILSDNLEDAQKDLDEATCHLKQHKSAFALVVKKGLFEPYTLQNKEKTNYELSREEAIKLVADSLNLETIIVSTTGMISRELYEHREKSNQGHDKDFLTVGSMGHSSSIALGIALSKPQREVYCFDGDGAAIMHLGSLGIIGGMAASNFKHVIFNNGAHDSVGGQPTVGFKIDLTAVAKACGYKQARRAETSTEIQQALSEMSRSPGPFLLEIWVNKGNRKDLGRPKEKPVENKEAFVKFLR